MARLAASFCALTALAVPVQAGDRALLDLIGYSSDAAYFAFEEFGIQDGSGLAYSTIYIVDLVNDSWVGGTPISVRADDEAAPLAQIRAKAMVQAREELATLDITVPGEIVAQIGDGVPDTDALTLRYGAPGYNPGEVLGDNVLELASFPATAAAPCADWFGVEPLGYQLTLSNAEGERLLHRDGALPRSRGCPTAYRLHGVAMPLDAAMTDRAVAIISVYPGGFEGPDRRFIAVPIAP